MLLITVIKMENCLKLKLILEAAASLFKTQSYPDKKWLRSKGLEREGMDN